jgi:hypothetical protein
MSIRGRCTCGNIAVHWHTVDYSVIPRLCQCQYCTGKHAAYVSKSGTKVDILIHKKGMHRIHRQGSKTAEFHECANCDDLVFVTARIDEELYCALNSNCLRNPRGFSPGVKTEFSDQTAATKLDRWRQNWCHPVRIAGQGSSGAVTSSSG